MGPGTLAAWEIVREGRRERNRGTRDTSSVRKRPSGRKFFFLVGLTRDREWKESIMSEAISTLNVTKCNGQDFQGWKFQMKALFLAHRTYDVVLGTRQIPDGDVREEAEATWNMDNARAMFLLSSAMEPDQLRSLSICVTAKEMWDALSRVHG